MENQLNEIGLQQYEVKLNTGLAHNLVCVAHWVPETGIQIKCRWILLKKLLRVSLTNICNVSFLETLVLSQILRGANIYK